MNHKKGPNKIDYEKYEAKLKQFLLQFEDDKINQTEQCYSKHKNKKYLIEIEKIANFDSRVIQIKIEDIQYFLRKDDQKQIVKHLKSNTLRFLQIFEKLVAQMMPQRTKTLNPQMEIEQRYKGYLLQQRKQNLINKSQTQSLQQNQLLPKKLNQNYDVCIIFDAQQKKTIKTISQIKSEDIGSIIITKAIVVRTSDVKPQLMIATYGCDVCGCQIYEEIQDSYNSYKPLTECRSDTCKSNRVSGKISFLPGHSKFRSFQQLKVQQTPEQLKRGAIPKNIKLELRGSLTNQICPGDLVQVQGIVLPRLCNKSLMVTDLYFDAYIYVTKIKRLKKKYSDFFITQEEKQQIFKARIDNTNQQLFNKLAESIAPQIYGLKNVKKALLLQMAGGQTISTSDNLRIRGQINIALFGDPGIAKSQLLKHISYISPRAVYTTGKGSSGVGLTAAIVADPITKQLYLQAGALVLADMGICCIDQFDKMQENDRTAIHEVMQQQTVSITKAGIITTLNARTAVLAAANPLYGRYNKKQSTQKNLNLPAALLSRFDLIFVLLDEANRQNDRKLALHIGTVHQKKQAQINKIFTQKFLKNYIALSKQIIPIIPQNIHNMIIQKYVQKRQLQMDLSSQGQHYTTMRSLLALIRLCQARARLRFSNQVTDQDVTDCIQIIQISKQNITKQVDKKVWIDKVGNIFDLIKDLCKYQGKVKMQDIYIRGNSKGYSQQQINNTISHYMNLNVLSTDKIQENVWLIG